MPTLPWTTPNTAPPGAEVHVFASRFETRTLAGARGPEAAGVSLLEMHLFQGRRSRVQHRLVCVREQWGYGTNPRCVNARYSVSAMTWFPRPFAWHGRMRFRIVSRNRSASFGKTSSSCLFAVAGNST